MDSLLIEDGTQILSETDSILLLEQQTNILIFLGSTSINLSS